MPQRIQSKSVSRKNRSGQGWCMPQTVRNFGLQLAAQQLWCWGRDIECPDGNLLLQYGFDQHRYRGKSERSTCYRLDNEDLHVSMWGFGVFFGHRDWGGLFLSRFDFCPTWAPIESLSLAIHQIADLPAFVRPNGAVQWRCAHQLWKSLLQWMTGYERWVKKTAGIDYRHECVSSWLRPFVRATQMAPAWQFISRRQWGLNAQPISQALSRYTF